MKISTHADRTEKAFGIRAEDIHKWIDGFFEVENFSQFLLSGERGDFDPYEHRKFRHCKEALEDAYREFEGKYTQEQIREVFESHIKDDYNGYLPSWADFANGTFKEKFHESEERARSETILSPPELAEYFKGKAYLHNKDKHKKILSGFHLKIVLPTIAAATLFIVSIFMIIIPVFRSSIMDREKEMIKELTKTATSVIESYIELEKSGELSRETAQNKAAEEISLLRYGTEMKDYFWITDMHPTMLMHPYRMDLAGQDVSEYQDSEDRSGKKLFSEFVELVKKDSEGYLEYQWQWKDDASRVAPKLSYVRLVPEWGWIVGTGVYIQDVEEAIGQLTHRLLWVFLAISFSLFGAILYVVSQSHKIENDRLRAEAGLLEAKERYRALVEASNEGYMLIIDGKNSYSNHTMQRMLGYTEKELAADSIWETILPVDHNNKDVFEHITQSLNDDSSSKEFEARIRTKSGSLLDAILTTSRIFFSQKNGHVVSIRKITHSNTGISANTLDKQESHSDLYSKILSGIKSSQTFGHVVHTLNRLPFTVREMIIHRTGSAYIRESISQIYEITLKKSIEFAMKEINKPPVEFAFISLGSNARHEMTMFSDQDNALIFADVEQSKINNTRRDFLKLADRVCSMLHKAGYPFCPGGVMAVNPRWCLSLTEWKNRFTKQAISVQPSSVLDINTFFDIRCVYGKDKLVDEFQSHMISITKENPEFFMHFARTCLTYQVPLNLFGQIKPGKQDGAKALNIKECIVPIVNFARLYALKNGITSPATITRLEALANDGHLKPETLSNIQNAFEHLWGLRFFNQIICHADLRRVNDELDLSVLTDAERKKLKDVLTSISHIQTKLSYDFLGTTLT